MVMTSVKYVYERYGNLFIIYACILKLRNHLYIILTRKSVSLNRTPYRSTNKYRLKWWSLACSKIGTIRAKPTG